MMKKIKRKQLGRTCLWNFFAQVLFSQRFDDPLEICCQTWKTLIFKMTYECIYILVFTFFVHHKNSNFCLDRKLWKRKEHSNGNKPKLFVFLNTIHRIEFWFLALYYVYVIIFPFSLQFGISRSYCAVSKH